MKHQISDYKNAISVIKTAKLRFEKEIYQTKAGRKRLQMQKKLVMFMYKYDISAAWIAKALKIKHRIVQDYRSATITLFEKQFNQLRLSYKKYLIEKLSQLKKDLKGEKKTNG